MNAPDLASPFRALCDDYGIDPEGASNSGDEDAGLYLDPDDADYVLARFVLVTKSAEFAYLKCFENRQAAMARAFDNIDDDIYAEGPVAVVDLVDGARWKPDYARCPWKAVAS